MTLICSSSIPCDGMLLRMRTKRRVIFLQKKKCRGQNMKRLRSSAQAATFGNLFYCAVASLAF